MDDGAPKLPNDLEQPVTSTPQSPGDVGPPPIVPPTTTPPPTPPQPKADRPLAETPPPDVPEESPKPIKPKSNFKKNLPKIAGGLLVMALLIGGILAGGNLLQQRTQVEQQATCKEGSVTNKGKTRETCVDGKKVESKIDPAEWSKLKDLEDPDKDGDKDVNLLKDVTFEATDDKTGKEVLDEIANNLLAGRSGVWEVDSSQNLPFCYAASTASECIVGRGGDGQFTGIAYYCPNDFGSSIDGLPGGCTGTAPITLEDFLSGNFCGTVQVDNIKGAGSGGYDKRSTKGCKEEEKEEAEKQIAQLPSPTPGVSPSPTPSPTSSYSCVDLTKDTAAPAMGDTVQFTCEANFSAVSPVAFFRHNVDGGSYTTSTAIPVDTTTKKASYSTTINQTGAWLAECRVCTDSSATSCTAWGQAN